MTNEYEKTEIVCVRLAVGWIKKLDKKVERINQAAEDEWKKTDRSKLIRKAIRKELY